MLSTTSFETRNQLDILYKTIDRELALIYREINANMDSGNYILQDGDFGYFIFKQVETMCTLEEFVSYVHKEMARRFYYAVWN